jgi:hypothetical protein
MKWSDQDNWVIGYQYYNMTNHYNYDEDREELCDKDKFINFKKELEKNLKNW